MPSDPSTHRPGDPSMGLVAPIRALGFRRSYVLRAGVLTNIPRHHTLGGFGAHEVARGLLAEVCRHTGAHPNGLLYSEHDVHEPDRPGPATVVTVIALAQLPDGAGLCVVTRYRQHPHIDRDDDWSIQLDEMVLDAESRRYPPSPPDQGGIVAWHLYRRRHDPARRGRDA